jgi:hypothetical protein
MEDQTRKPKASFEAASDGKFDLDALLHPARAFAHPMDVVRDPDLALNEKRAILASWTSDACALEAAPDLRVTTSGRVSAGTTSWMPFALSTVRLMAMADHFLTTSEC